MAHKETYELTAPDGTQVEVKGAPRRDALLGRGYQEGHTSDLPTQQQPSDEGSKKKS